jgi:MFS transporter, DHA1 family, inner membrane transport protein
MEKEHRPLTPLVALFIVTRIVVNASYRVTYPFLPVFAAGMGVSLQTAALALSGRSLAGAAGPLLGPIADRYGRKTGMLLGLALYSAATGLVVLWPSFPAFVIGLMLANLGNLLFLPSMQAFLGDKVPYGRRGAILALTELSWSLSFILLVPLLGLVITRAGWAAPFGVLSGLSFLALLVLAWRIPGDRPHASASVQTFWHNLRIVLASPPARPALAFSLAITLANEIINLIFGAWMKDAFGLQIAALGFAATVIGLAELVGEFAVVALVDRIGKKRAVRIGLAISLLAALALPVVGRTLWGALAGLFLFYLGFEFTLVSYISVMTEVLPGARATLMSMNLAATSLGRAAGAAAGSWLYSFGFGANALVAMALNLIAFFILTRVKVEEKI